jgi:23S rRNA (guanine745-N1)-methyltransferase
MIDHNAIKTLCCPLDHLPFQLINKQLQCPSGHSFDIARQGYVNLLPVQQKRSKNPGDNQEMVAARARFLSTGHYSEIANTLFQLVQNHLKPHSQCILDAGCGDGYYLNGLQQYLTKNPVNAHLSFTGMDISKQAIIAACKQSKEITWIVASNKNPPIQDSAVDMILCMFGFPSAEGFQRILKQNGLLLVVEPGPQHLIELREILYPDVRSADNSSARTQSLTKNFSLIEELQKKFFIELNQTEIQDLAKMTPHYYRSKPDAKNQLQNISQAKFTLDIGYQVFQT